MPERIYVASSFEQKEDVKDVHKKIIDAGHEVTADWTTHVEIASLDSEEARKNLKAQYVLEDTEGVTSASVYALLIGDRKSTGAHIEFGIAIGAKVGRICLIGKPDESQLFYSHPAVSVFPDVDSFIESL